MHFLPTKESTSQHQVPEWFHDAKLGIFIHWGLFSVPAWAVDKGNMHEIREEHGGEFWFTHNPYAEWYANTMKLEGSPTWEYHQQTYGSDFAYEDFSKDFNQSTKNFSAEGWAKLFKKIGARYSVLTTKHHDGFLLWDSNHPNPLKENYQAEKDLVGDFVTAMRSEGIRPGLYYSGGPDWVFNSRPMRLLLDIITFIPESQQYADYVDTHYRELIDRYHPDILWNDIGYPAKGDVFSIFADYLNEHPEGVINDRFTQPKMWLFNRFDFLRKALNELVEFLIRKKVNLTMFFKGSKVGDFETPEYAQMKEITDYKWETCRGIGNSFGYNQNDTAENLISAEEVIHLFIDVVSKNGSLLLNVGPQADGTIPQNQQAVLEGFGDWLNVNGEALFDTRPWIRAEGQTASGIPIRFTKKGSAIFALTLGDIQDQKISFKFPADHPISNIILLGNESHLDFNHQNGILEISIPENITSNAAHAFKIQQLQE